MQFPGEIRSFTGTKKEVNYLLRGPDSCFMVIGMNYQNILSFVPQSYFSSSKEDISFNDEYKLYNTLLSVKSMSGKIKEDYSLILRKLTFLCTRFQFLLCRGHNPCTLEGQVNVV
jgi:hypothetical protein